MKTNTYLHNTPRTVFLLRAHRAGHSAVQIPLRHSQSQYEYIILPVLTSLALERLRDICTLRPFAIELTRCRGVEELEAVWLQRPPKRERERERETRLSRHSAPCMPNNVLCCIHVYRLDSVLFFSCITINTSVDMSCAHKISRKHLKWNANCLGL